MVDCPFAIGTDKGTLCQYKNGICRNEPTDCITMSWAIEDFRDALCEHEYSMEFMKMVVAKYGNKEE